MRHGYRIINGASALAALPLATRKMPVDVWFGGARSGDGGGPLVKARILKQHFKDTPIGYSLLYLLSNALYLPDPVMAAIRARDIPIVLNQNGVFYPAWHPQGWEKENARIAGAYHRASHVFWQSDFCRRCANHFLGERDGPGEILPNAVDTKRFKPLIGEKRDRPFTMLLTGMIGPSTAYRLSSSLDGLAVARANGLDVLLHVAGFVDKAVQGNATQQIERLGLQNAVRFLGPYSGADAPAIYQSADGYLMTKHNDPCPNVVIEAMSSGLPILYSASGGVPELVGPDAGVGIPVEESFEKIIAPEAIAIAEGLERLIATREKLAVAARTRATNKFDLSKWIGRHQTVFEQLVRDGQVNQ